MMPFSTLLSHKGSIETTPTWIQVGNGIVKLQSLTFLSFVSQGQLTDLRTALVSNGNLAMAAIRLGIHKYLNYVDPNLSDFIQNFSNAVSNCEINSIWRLEVRLSWHWFLNQLSISGRRCLLQSKLFDRFRGRLEVSFDYWHNAGNYVEVGWKTAILFLASSY